MCLRSRLASLIAIVTALYGIVNAMPVQQPPGPDPGAQRRVSRPPRKLLPLDGAISYFIAAGIDRSRYMPGDAQLAVWAFEEWQRATPRLRFIRTDDESNSVVRLYWVPWRATELGATSSFGANGRPAASVFVAPDTRHLPAALARAAAEDPLMRDTIVYFLCLHEIGHALGLAHTADPADIMQAGGHADVLFPRLRTRISTRASIPMSNWLSNNDRMRVASLYD